LKSLHGGNPVGLNFPNSKSRLFTKKPMAYKTV
jgi:hypothetical protein